MRQPPPEWCGDVFDLWGALCVSKPFTIQHSHLQTKLILNHLCGVSGRVVRSVQLCQFMNCSYLNVFYATKLWYHIGCKISLCVVFNTFSILRPQNWRHFADDIFKCIFLNEKVWISLKFSLTFVAKVRIGNSSALVQIMAWHRPCDKPLSEPMMVSLPSHICLSRHQWVMVVLI